MLRLQAANAAAIVRPGGLDAAPTLATLLASLGYGLNRSGRRGVKLAVSDVPRG